MAQPPIKKGAIDTGTGADQIVALDGSGNMPAVDGSAITDLNATQLTSGSIPNARVPSSAVTQHQGALSINGSQLVGTVDADTLGGQPVGTGPLDIVALDGSSRLPAVDASQLTNVPGAGRNGAVVTRSSNFTIGNNVYTVINWDQESYDDNNHHDNVTNSNQLVVPAGVSRIKLAAHVAFTSDVNGQRVIQFRKNGGFSAIGTNIPTPSHWVRANDIPTLALTSIDAETPILDVSPGDWFEVRAGVWNAGASLSVLTESWFSLEVIE